MKLNKVDIEIKVATFLVNVYVLFLCDKNHEMSNTSHHHLLSVTCHVSRVTCHVSQPHLRRLGPLVLGLGAEVLSLLQS